MKKKNVLLFVLLLMLTFGFSNKVNAKATIGFMECRYSLSDPSAIESSWRHEDGTVSFFYSGIITADYSTGQKVYYGRLAKNYDALFGAVSSKNNFDNRFFPYHKIADFKLIDSSFNSKVGDDGTCPQYFFLSPSKKEKWNARFGNLRDLNTYCWEDRSRCALIGTRIDSKSSAIMLYDAQTRWVYYWGVTHQVCDLLRLEMFVDNDSKLKATVYYDPSSEYIDDSAKTKKTVEVQYFNAAVPGANALRYIYKFLNTKKLAGETAIDVRNKKESVELNREDRNNNHCKPHDLQLTTTYPSCTLYSAIVDKVEAYESTVKLATEIIAKFTKEYMVNKYPQLKDSLQPGNYELKDYSTYEDADELQSIWQAIYDFRGGDDGKYTGFMELIDEAIAYIDKYEPDICTKDKREIQLKRASIESYYGGYEAWWRNLGETVKRIETRLEELNSLSEEQEEEQLGDKIIEEAEQLKHFYEVHRPSYLNGNQGLSYKPGCGLITPEFKTWLLKLFDIIKVLSLTLTLILGMFDFFKGLASGNADTMKKVWTSFSRRLIVVVILFLLPVIIEFALGIVNIPGVIVDDPLCGLK